MKPVETRGGRGCVPGHVRSRGSVASATVCSMGGMSPCASWEGELSPQFSETQLSTRGNLAQSIELLSRAGVLKAGGPRSGSRKCADYG